MVSLPIFSWGWFRFQLPAICSGESYFFSLLTIRRFNFSLWSIFLNLALAAILRSFVFSFAPLARYLPEAPPFLFSSLDMADGSLWSRRAIAFCLWPARLSA